MSSTATPDLPDKTVTLRLENGLAVPEHDPIKVQRHQQKIKWSAPFEFQIQINDYDGDVKYKNNGGTYEAKTGYFSGKTHKYSIIANGQTNDPEIVVEP